MKADGMCVVPWRKKRWDMWGTSALGRKKNIEKNIA
jgi:hypothetical protein